MTELEEQELYKSKKLIYYERLVDAWITTRIEKDKALLFLAAGGISWLITLLTTVKILYWYCIMMLVIAILSFSVTCIMVVFFISKGNTEYIECLVHEKEEEKEEKKTKKEKSKAKMLWNPS